MRYRFCSMDFCQVNFCHIHFGSREDKMKKYLVRLVSIVFVLLVSTSWAQIKLCENAWSGSSVNTYVAKIILEQHLSKEVEVITIDENSMWAGLATGDISACLEVWPSGHAENVAEYIDNQQVVENLGDLGVVGKISWYIPSYMLESNPELATWEGFSTPEVAQLFATAQTGDKGQFLAGDPSYVQYDEQIINNLGLEFQVVVGGSEQATLAALDGAYNRQEPLLFYFWTPHSVHASYDLTAVKLPDYSEACYAKIPDNGVDCDYPEDVLFKIAYAGLAEEDPEAYTLLKNFNYSNNDQIGMIAKVDSGEMTAEEAAQEWVDANEAVWKPWLP
jgi:glycine betaine/proline transport system substrate-binding protein